MSATTEGKSELNSRQARKSPEWLTRSVMYQIYLRSFTPEGTIKATTARLPKLAELGVDVLYLCPICVQDDDMRTEFWSDRQNASGLNNPRNPYRIKDFYNIDPEYGNDADLHEFVTEAHKLGMRVILDIVYFHCGPTAVFIGEHPDFVQRDKNGEVANGHWHFPMLNFESQNLREYLWQNLEYWIKEFSVDGYRCDVAGAVPLDFWEVARDRLEKLNPEIIMLSESDAPDHQVQAFDLNYNFKLVLRTFPGVYSGEKPVSAIRETLEEMASERPQGVKYIRYTDNHDIAHDTRENRLEKDWGIDGAAAALVMAFVMDGMPFLYNGQEVADTAPHSIYGNFPIDWKNEETEEGKARFELISSLCKLRHENRVLSDGDMQWVDNDNPQQVLSFVRTLGDEKVLVAFNLSKTDVKARVDIVADIKNGGIVLGEKAEACFCSGDGVEISFGRFGYLVAGI